MITKIKTRKGRFVANTFFSWLAWVFPLLLSFLATPIVVKGLGNESYGLYVLITGFVSYSFGFGIGRTAAKYVAEYRAKGENEKLSDVISATFWFSFAVGLIGTVLVAAFARYIVSDVLQIAPDLQETAITGLYLGCTTILIYMVSQIFQSVLQGINRFDRYSILINLNGILFQAGNIFLVLQGYGILALLCWNLFIVCLICFLFYVSAKRLLPEFSINFRIKKETIVTVLKYGAGIILFQVFTNLLFIFERGWVTRKLGTEAVTFYVVPMTLAIFLQGFVGSLVLAMFPAVNELLEEKDKLTDLYQKATKIILALIAFCVVTLICGGKVFLAVWISREFSNAAFPILAVHAITFGMIGLLTIAWQLAEGFGYAGINASITLTWVVISIPLMIILANSWQGEGVAASRLIGVLATMPVIFYIERKFLGRIDWSFWLKIFLSIGFAVVLVALFEWQVFSRFDPGWIVLTIGTFFGGLTYCSLLLLTGFLTKEERDILKTMLPGR